jgi:DNA-binding MarR family transcriptional regulator
LIFVWRNLHLASVRVRGELDVRLSAEAGCSLVEHDLMAWLAAAPSKRLRMLDLSRRLALSPGGLTHLTGRLVERGWVERETPAANRREVYAVLTPAGNAALRSARATYLQVLRETLSRQLDTSELEALATITGKLLDRGDGEHKRAKPHG